MNLSIFIPVFNEEKRVENLLKSVAWIPNIFILDKGSTDRTIEICNKYNTTIINVGYSEPYETSYFDEILEKYCKTEWMIIATGSDIIHPRLSIEIKNFINSSISNQYDLLMVPFQTYILGLNYTSSPWYTEKKAYVFKKSIFRINKEGVHDGFQFVPNKIYEINLSNEYCVYHLTHETVSSMMSRHMSYWQGEAILPKNINLRKSFLVVIRKMVKILVKKRIYTKGWDGIMIAFSYLTYYMMSFVYQWEIKKSNATIEYDKIRNNIINEISNYN